MWFFIIGHMHYLVNESKMLIFAYNSDQRVYTIIVNEFHTM